MVVTMVDPLSFETRQETEQARKRVTGAAAINEWQKLHQHQLAAFVLAETEEEDFKSVCNMVHGLMQAGKSAEPEATVEANAEAKQVINKGTDGRGESGKNTGKGSRTLRVKTPTTKPMAPA